MLIVKKIGCPYCIDFETNVEPELKKMLQYDSKWIGPSERETLWFGKVRCSMFPCIIFQNKSGMVREFPRPSGTGEEQAKAIVKEHSKFETSKEWRLRK